MIRNRWGIHLPNGPLADDKVFGLGVSHYTFLHLQADEYAWRCREASPDGLLLTRFYLPNWAERDPTDWASECAREYLRTRFYAGREYSLQSLRCHVTGGNEMNLPEEGGGWTAEWYERINAWVLAWTAEFQWQTGCPPEMIHFPAFAYGHSDDSNELGYVGMEICRPAINACGILDVHPYWFEPAQVMDRSYGRRFELAHDLYPGKPLFCSELGNFDVTRASTPDEIIVWFESLPSYVIGGTPFIWENPTGAHRSNDWSRNPAIGERIAAHPKQEVDMPSQFSFAFGFAALHDANPEEIGDATSEQVSIPNVFDFQFTSNGVLVYRPGIEPRAGDCKFFAQAVPFV